MYDNKNKYSRGKADGNMKSCGWHGDMGKQKLRMTENIKKKGNAWKYKAKSIV